MIKRLIKTFLLCCVVVVAVAISVILTTGGEVCSQIGIPLDRTFPWPAPIIVEELIPEGNGRYEDMTIGVVCEHATNAKVSWLEKALNEQRSIKEAVNMGLEDGKAIIDVRLYGNPGFLAELMGNMSNGPAVTITEVGDDRIFLEFE